MSNKRLDDDEKMFENHIERTKQFEGVMRKSFILDRDGEDTPENKKYGRGLSELKTAIRIQQEHTQNKQRSYLSPSFWQTIIVQNADLFSTVFLELNGLLFLYPLHTIKTRIQSQHKTQDVAYFLKNQVAKQPVYSGIGYGMLSCMVSNVMMYSIYQLASFKMEMLSQYSQFEQKLASFLIADFITTPFKMTLETHKQLIQMSSKDTSLSTILQKSKQAFLPTLLRELSFRASFLSLYQLCIYSQTPTDTTPTASLRYNSLTAATLLALIISNPFDLIATKLTTQQINKYTGMTQCLQMIYKEEGAMKLAISGLWPRTMYYCLNATLFFHFYDAFRACSLEAFQLH